MLKYKRLRFLGKKKKRDKSFECFRKKKCNPSNNVKELIKLHETADNTKLYLIKNNLEFAIIGKGKLKVIYGEVELFGYRAFPLKINESFDFDESEACPVISCLNYGRRITNLNDIDIDDELKNKGISNLTHYILGEGSAKFSILQFSEGNFLIDEISNIASRLNCIIINSSKYDPYFKSYLETDSSFSITIDFSRYKTFVITGKKNSGKSTFLTLFINKIFSHIHGNSKCKCVYLIECDSLHPWVSTPFAVSLIKINSPIFQNLTISSKSYQIIESIYINDNENFKDYMTAVEYLYGKYKIITSDDFLVLNPFGNSSFGYENLYNSAIIEMVRPDLTLFIKNSNQGRVEKGEEFENFIVHDEEKSSMGIILAEYQFKNSHSGKSSQSSHSLLEKKVCLIENNFALNESQSIDKKSVKKKIQILMDIIGEENYKSHCITTYNIEQKICSILFSGRSINFLANCICEISLENILLSISMPYDCYCSWNDLDVLMAFNSKFCAILEISPGVNFKVKNLNFCHVVNLNHIPIKARHMLGLGKVLNIDPISRKMYVLSEKLKVIAGKLLNNRSQLVLHMFNEIEKNCKLKKNFYYEDVLLSQKFSFNLFFKDFKNENEPNASTPTHHTCYVSRNNFTLI